CERHRAEPLTHVERSRDVGSHPLGRRYRCIPEAPEVAVRSGGAQRGLVRQLERLEGRMRALERHRLDECHDTAQDYRPVRAMNATRSNRCTSCSFLSNAPYSGGTMIFLSLLRSASGGMSSASRSFSQSSNSEVDGFFFSPGMSRSSKKTSSASCSKAFFKPGKCTSTIRAIVALSGNLM